jgi:YVTN family beta-propeller protein
MIKEITLMQKTIFTMAILTSALLADTIYVSNEKDNTISVIDSLTNKVTNTIKVGQRPRGILLSNDYSKLYICASDDDTVQVMDTQTNKILYNLPSGEDPEQFALTPDGKELYIANEDDAIVTVVNTEKNQ